MGPGQGQGQGPGSGVGVRGGVKNDAVKIRSLIISGIVYVLLMKAYNRGF